MKMATVWVPGVALGTPTVATVPTIRVAGVIGVIAPFLMVKEE